MTLHKMRGMTLIELMVVVTIISILAAIGYPSYTQYVIRGKRSEGRTALMDTAAKLERFYSNNNVYATAADTFPAAAGVVTPTETGRYDLTIDVDTPFQTFTLTANPTFSDPECGNLTLTHAGAKGNTGAGTLNTCWGK